MAQKNSRKKKLIAASILAADFANLEKEIERARAAGADWIHVDVMDGHFVPNITVGVPVVKSLKRISKLPIDVHLMIEHPEKFIADFIRAGADFLTIHVEATQQPELALKQIRELGARCGISLRPGTPLEKIKPYLETIDLALVMTVEPGFGGQKFLTDQVARLEQLKKWTNGLNKQILIEVDGGINARTAELCAAADVLVAGSFVFSGDTQKAIAALRGTI